MALRVIGGEFRSRLLQAPRGMDTRPTRAMVREAAFNILQGRCPGAQVLDLFSGSGAMGFEALSRGAEFAVFSDTSREAVEAVKANAATLGVGQKCQVLHADWQKAFRRLQGTGRRFHLVFLDPPYGLGVENVLGLLPRLGLMAGGGLAVVEHSVKYQPAVLPGYSVFRIKTYGQTALTVMEWGDEQA